MHKRRVAAFFLGALVTCAGLGVGIAAKTKGASVEKMEVVRLDGKIVYRLPPGATLVGEPVPSPGGDATAFLERKDGDLTLVVCIKGADPARWDLPAEARDYHIFWTEKQRVVLGRSRLHPRLAVSWHLSYE
jgi:hypothetical protein